MGTGNMRSFLGQRDCQMVAVCDVDRKHRERAKAIVDKKYGNKDCQAYHDFRDLLARDDIDAVVVATPDHWHGVVAVAAAAAGKDIYGEKPIGHTLVEGRAIADAVHRYHRIWQTGSWQRSQRNFRYACELVLNGRIGKVHKIEVGLPVDNRSTQVVEAVSKSPPEHLDYDRWVGPSHVLPYQPGWVHFHWRWNLAFGGGAILDWVGHHVDIAHWGMGWDHTGPVEIEGSGTYQDQGIYDAAHQFRVWTRYRGGEELIIAGNDGIPNGTKWIGDLGWVYVDRGRLDAHPKSLLQERFSADEVHLTRSPGHHREFLDCVKTRRETLTPAETAHRSASPGHLGQIAMMLGRKIRWNPDTEEIIGDDTASRLLGNPLRSPWRV